MFRKKLIPALGNGDARQLIKALSDVCMSHGEDLSFIQKLNKESTDWLNEKSNLQFVSMMIRLGDIIHFDSSRAPMSLYAEKMICNPISELHWTAKNQDLKYMFEADDQGKTVIAFSAFCTSPELYYFIHEYVDCIDCELENFFTLSRNWKSKENDNDRYQIYLSEKVNRNNIDYDDKLFTPNRELHFVLNQSKILELLMGVQLYKDPLLCLREVYQNALDATKCMIAYNNTRSISEKVSVTFGLGMEEVNGKQRKYIYCLDHGTGMNEYIIQNYFLCIGKSYYKSADFMRSNTNWGDFVKPTSQFGIGILSTFMIADRINITTKYYDNDKSLSFTITGPTEYFFYCKPNNIIEERIGNHGSFIKLYLKTEYEELLNNFKIDKMPIILMLHDKSAIKNYGEEKTIMYNLMYILSQHIGVTIHPIDVNVELEDGNMYPIYENNTVFDYRNYSGITTEDVEKLWVNFFYRDRENNPYKQVIENRDYIEDYVIHINSDDFELYLPISLPIKGIKMFDIRIFDFHRFLGDDRGVILVDGIKTSRYNHLEINLDYEVLSNSIINYIGKKRPILSVDRNSIISMPCIDEEYDKVKEEIIVQIKETVFSHIAKYKIIYTDPEWAMILDYLIRLFPQISSEVINQIHSEHKDWLLYEDNNLKKSNVEIQNVFTDDIICIENVDFRRYREISRHIIFRKAISADRITVNNDRVSIQGSTFSDVLPFREEYFSNRSPSLSSLMIRADEWSGKYEDYDIVTGIWPIVPDYLFDKYTMCLRRSCSNITNSTKSKYKHIDCIGNGIQGIANLDPVLINPAIGISQKVDNHFGKTENYVGKYEKIQHNFFIREFAEDFNYYVSNELLLYAFISPRDLTNDELITLTEFEEKDPEYVRGVREGYSILFVGGSDPEYYISVGIVSRNDMLKMIPDSIKKRYEGKTIRFLNGTVAFEL